MRYVYFKRGKSWYFHLKSANGQIVLQSEGYKRKSALLRTIATIKRSGSAPVLEKV
jgi:uncharacterized protein YegP (UPF0339 family)